MKPHITLILLIGSIFCALSSAAQSVGIGTEAPNQNAILELVAPNSDQGLLVPRMTTAQRTASTFINNLSEEDNGLMVFDEELNKFFFWINNQWVELATGNLNGLPDQAGQAGKYLSTDGSNSLWEAIDFNSLANIPVGIDDGDDVNDADADATNEIQDLSLTVNSLAISGSTTTIDLSSYLDNTDSQSIDFSGGILTLSGDPNATAIDFSSYDADGSDDFSGAFANLTGIPSGLEDGDDVNDADSDITNELQDLTLAGTTLSLTNSSIGIDLTPFSGTNTDNQTLSIAGSDLSISGGNSLDISSVDTQLTEAEVDAFTNNNGYLITEIDGSVTNEIQDLSISGNTLSLSGSASSIDLSSFSNTDDQILSIAGSDLSISGGNTLDISSVDTQLSETEVDAFANNNGYLTSEVDGSITNEIQDISTSGAAGNLTISDGSTITLNVDDGDADDSNEIQDLSISGNTLSLTGSSSSIDLSPFSGTNTDNQTLSIAGSDLSISGGNTLDISSVNTQLSEAEVDAFANNNGYLITEVDGSISNEIQDISSNGSAGNITISDGSTITLNVDDGDADDSNEFQTITLMGSDVTLSDGGGTFSINDSDSDASNEFQTVTKLGNTVTLSDGGGSFTVADDDNSTSNEIQDISTDGGAGNISLSSGSTLNLNVDDGDADDSNEFQTVNKVGNTVTLSDGGGSFTVADNDNSTSNEVQTVSRSGNNVRLSINNSSASVLDFDPAAFKATSTAKTIPTGFSVLTFDVEVYDVGDSFDSGGIFNVPADGLYNLGGQLIFETVPTGLVQILILDASMNVLYSKAFAANSIQSSIAFSVDLSLTGGDKISVGISNTNQGGSEATAFNVIASPDQTNFFFCGKRFN